MCSSDLSASFAEKLRFGLINDIERPAQELLSKREYQILRMLSSGRTVTEIAADLSLSVKTVSTHRSRILDKTGLQKNADIVQYVFSHQLQAR